MSALLRKLLESSENRSTNQRFKHLQREAEQKREDPDVYKVKDKLKNHKDESYREKSEEQLTREAIFLTDPDALRDFFSSLVQSQPPRQTGSLDNLLEQHHTLEEVKEKGKRGQLTLKLHLSHLSESPSTLTRIGLALLRSPYGVLHAALELGVNGYPDISYIIEFNTSSLVQPRKKALVEDTALEATIALNKMRITNNNTARKPPKFGAVKSRGRGGGGGGGRGFRRQTREPEIDVRGLDLETGGLTVAQAFEKRWETLRPRSVCIKSKTERPKIKKANSFPAGTPSAGVTEDTKPDFTKRETIGTRVSKASAEATIAEIRTTPTPTPPPSPLLAAAKLEPSSLPLPSLLASLSSDSQLDADQTSSISHHKLKDDDDSSSDGSRAKPITFTTGPASSEITAQDDSGAKLEVDDTKTTRVAHLMPIASGGEDRGEPERHSPNPSEGSLKWMKDLVSSQEDLTDLVKQSKTLVIKNLVSIIIKYNTCYYHNTLTRNSKTFVTDVLQQLGVWESFKLGEKLEQYLQNLTKGRKEVYKSHKSLNDRVTYLVTSGELDDTTYDEARYLRSLYAIFHLEESSGNPDAVCSHSDCLLGVINRHLDRTRPNETLLLGEAEGHSV